MSLLIFAIIWYIIGAIGCALAATSDIKRGLDFTLIDLIGCVIASSVGFIALMLGFMEYSKYHKIPNMTLIKGKK